MCYDGTLWHPMRGEGDVASLCGCLNKPFSLLITPTSVAALCVGWPDQT